jgi:hypothetical protein
MSLQSLEWAELLELNRKILGLGCRDGSGETSSTAPGPQMTRHFWQFYTRFSAVTSDDQLRETNGEMLRQLCSFSDIQHCVPEINMLLE